MTIDEFIKGIRELDPLLMETILSEGGCYRFAKLVKMVFPEAKLYRLHISEDYGPIHVVVKYQDKWYDIHGEKDPRDVNQWYPTLIRSNDKWLNWMESWSFSDHHKAAALTVLGRSDSTYYNSRKEDDENENRSETVGPRP